MWLLNLLNVCLVKVICLILTYLKTYLQRQPRQPRMLKQTLKEEILEIRTCIKTKKSQRTHRVCVEKGTFVKNKVSNVCCFYCMKHGHTSNKCNIKHVGVPNGKYAWVKAVKWCILAKTNPKDPYWDWGPKILANLFCRNNLSQRSHCGILTVVAQDTWLVTRKGSSLLRRRSKDL